MTSQLTTFALHNDYYHTVNNNWLESVVLPDDMSKISQFDILIKENLKKIIQLYKSKFNDKPEYQNLVVFIDAGLNKGRDIKEVVQFIKKLREYPVYKMLALMNIFGMNNCMDFYVSNRLKDNKEYIIHLDEPELSLPKVYYKDEKYTDIFTHYTKYVADCCNILKQHNVHINASNVLAIEKEISNYVLSKDDKRDIEKHHREVAYSEMCRILHNLDFEKYIGEFKIISNTMQNYNIKIIGVNNLEYFKKFNKLLEENDRERLMDYLIFKAFNSSMPFLDETLQELHFNFFGKILSGVSKMKSLEYRVINMASLFMGDLLGKAYGETYFDVKKKEYISDIITNIKAVIDKKIENSQWMEEKTKQKAKIKLLKMQSKIGYPDVIEDHSSLKLSGSYFQQGQLLAWHNINLNLKKLSQKQDKRLWEIGAHEVNAYYNPIKNEIVFPAGILQPPFFDIAQNDVYNYGSIGSVIGHEICHGFDDQGKSFDENGNMVDWWTAKDHVKYQNKTSVLIQQYGNLSLHDHKLNGKLTLGENIADICGLANALDALKYAYDKKKRILTNNDKDGFFKAYGQLWRQVITKEEMIRRINIDPHSPGVYRVNQVLKNIPDFYTTYSIKPWNKMYLAKHQRFDFW